MNKIAFQQDAYRPRVDRISQHALCRGGAWSWGGCAWSQGGAWSREEGAWSWGCVHGLGGVVSQHALRQTPPL